MNRFLFFILLMNSIYALAHEGHGLEGSHSHATDALGFVVTIMVIAAMIWTGRK